MVVSLELIGEVVAFVSVNSEVGEVLTVSLLCVTSVIFVESSEVGTTVDPFVSVFLLSSISSSPELFLSLVSAKKTGYILMKMYYDIAEKI